MFCIMKTLRLDWSVWVLVCFWVSGFRNLDFSFMKTLFVGAIALLLIFSLSLYLVHLPLVNAASGEMTWGHGLTIKEYYLVTMNDEIPPTNYAYVFQKMSQESYTILAQYWSNLLMGNLQDVRNQIELHIPGSQVQWLHISWSDVQFSVTGFGPSQVHWATVKGFMVEALVKNNNAGLTGLEIVAIIMASAVLAVVIGLLITAGWVVWRVATAIDILPPWLSPWVMLAFGLIVLVGIGALLYFVLGGKLSYSSKKRSLGMGK